VAFPSNTPEATLVVARRVLFPVAIPVAAVRSTFSRHIPHPPTSTAALFEPLALPAVG